jgi:hypothetical protein
VQDDHVAAAIGLDQVWLTGGWEQQFGLPLDPADIGYGHSPEQAGLVRAPAKLLAAYHDATYDQTVGAIGQLTGPDLAVAVDERWEPPVTMAVRLVSVLSDDLQHAGQAAFLRGLIERRG